MRSQSGLSSLRVLCKRALRYKRCKKLLIKVAYSLIKIKHNKDVTASDMKNAVMPLIQMCTDGLTFLAHGNNLFNQTCRNYITSVLPPAHV